MARTVTAQEFMEVGASPSRAEKLADQINTIDPSIRDRYSDTVKGFYSAYGNQGYELSINQAARTNAQQQAIKASGVKAASPNNTWHTVAAAVDFSIHKKGTLDKGTTLKNAYDTLLAPIAQKFGLANPIKNDVGHFMPTEFPAARRGRSVADFIDAIPETQFANVPIPAEKPTQVAAAEEQPQGLLSAMFSQPTAAARDFSGVTSDELAQSLAPNANIAPAGILADSLAPAPSASVQQAMLASLPGALPAAPVSPVSVASLGPVTQYSSLPAAPVQEVTSAPLRDVPSNALSAPVGPVERGLLADLPSNLAAAPVGAVEAGGMLRPASEPTFAGNPNLSELGQFASPDEDLAKYGINPDVVPTGPAPMDFAINNNPTGNMGLLGLDKVAATPSVNEALMGPTSGPQNGRPNNAPTEQTYTGNYALVDNMRFDPFANPMGAPLGSVQTPVTPDQNFGLLASAPSSLPSLSPPQEVAQYTVASVQPAPTQSSIEEARTSLDVTDDEYAAQLAAAGLSVTEIQMALNSRLRPDTYTRAPMTAPPAAPTVTQPGVGPTSAPAAQQTYSMPSAMDVWNGMATRGIATDGTTVNRNPDGTVTRTNTYGVTETYNPSTDRWTGGAPRTQGFELPSKERAVQLGKETLGPIAGGLLGNALLGPVGGLLGAVVARNMAQGKGLLGNQLQSPNSISAQNQIAKTFGYSGATPGAGDPQDYGYSPAAHDSIARGETVGLF